MTSAVRASHRLRDLTLVNNGHAMTKNGILQAVPTGSKSKEAVTVFNDSTLVVKFDKNSSLFAIEILHVPRINEKKISRKTFKLSTN